MNTKTYLDGEIKRIYDKMSTMDPNSEEYGKLESKWNEYVDRKLEFEKHEASVDQADKQMKEARKDRAGRLVTEIFKVGVPLGVSVGMTFLLVACEAKGVVPFGVGKKWLDRITKY